MNGVVYHPVTKRQEALDLYIKGWTLPSVAKELGVPYGTVHHWHTGEGWAGMRRQMRADLLDDWKERFRVRTVVEMYRTMTLHISAAQELALKIGEAAAKEGVTPKELATLASALRSEYLAIEPLLRPLLQETPDNRSASGKVSLNPGLVKAPSLAPRPA